MSVNLDAIGMTCRRLVCLLASMMVTALYAGDEDMSPSAYHVFDPETGYMMTVDPMSEEQATDAGSAAADEATASPGMPADDAAKPQNWMYLLAALVIGAAFLSWKRHHGTKTPRADVDN